MNTEVLLEGSHKNSTVLSCVGFALGSMMPTDMGISAGAHAESRVLLGGEAEGSRGIWDRLQNAAELWGLGGRPRGAAPGTHRCPGSCPRVCSTASPPAAGAPCTAGAGRETPPGKCSGRDKPSAAAALPANPPSSGHFPAQEKEQRGNRRDLKPHEEARTTKQSPAGPLPGQDLACCSRQPQLDPSTEALRLPSPVSR